MKVVNRGQAEAFFCLPEQLLPLRTSQSSRHRNSLFIAMNARLKSKGQCIAAKRALIMIFVVYVIRLYRQYMAKG